MEICLGDGLYNFTIRDDYGDSFFQVSFNDQIVLASGSFNANVTEVLNIGFKPKSGVISEHEHQYRVGIVGCHSIYLSLWGSQSSF
jgi:hypothetical protein